MPVERNVVDAVSVAIVRDGRTVLVERGRDPSKGLYAFPGGRVEEGETHEDAARREVMEETALAVADLKVLRDLVLFHDTEPIEYRLRVFVSHDTAGELRAGSDAASAGFFAVEELATLPLTETTRVIALELLSDG